MTRTIISLPEDDKKWLDAYAGRQRISSAEVIRRAICEYRAKKSQKDLAAVLRETAGSWSSISGDSRDYIDAVRREWERKP
ncbi:MAG: ribbon-helix-helix protein, CopG family [Acidobacteriota bacterium]|nr:ribbon-helix-helix protein, CopG family [Acidobacteriota bacterium]